MEYKFFCDVKNSDEAMVALYNYGFICFRKLNGVVKTASGLIVFVTKTGETVYGGL